MNDDYSDWLQLTNTPGLGAAAQRSLLAAFGLPHQILAASAADLAAVVGSDKARLLQRAPDAERIARTRAWLAEDDDNHIVTLADASYPPALLELPDPPVLLYVKGTPECLARPSLAIVGARSATQAGSANAEAFATNLAEAGLCVVSGLAAGIDAAAHRGALKATGGATIAVIGTGADRVYPARNKSLAHQIVAHGAIVSEYPLGTPPLPHNFPRRNRIIAGLARGVLVVEAAVGSGSLITAQLAGESGREVFAIPGSIHSPLSRGCHLLIRNGAKLVETAADVLEELRWPVTAMPGAAADARSATRASGAPPAPAAPLPEADPTLDAEARQVLTALGHDPLDVDTLAQRSGLTVDALYAILLPLELAGNIARLPGGRFQRL